MRRAINRGDSGKLNHRGFGKFDRATVFAFFKFNYNSIEPITVDSSSVVGFLLFMVLL